MEKIKEKKCFKCNNTQPMSEFYKHKGMVDGHINKCKTCTKNEIETREKNLRKDPEWVEQERVRQREKYYRLGYKNLYKPTTSKKKETMRRYRQKFPEKYLAAKYTEIFVDKKKGFNLHHWSYNQSDWLDTIELTIKDHNLVHRYLVYDQSKMMFRTLNGDLLNTKEKHLEYINQCKNLQQIVVILKKPLF